MLTTPSLSTLYWNDRTFSGSLKLILFPLLFAAGFYWVTQPVPGVEPIPGPSFEAEIAPYVLPVAGSLAAIGLLILVRRYLFVRRVLTEGSVIKAKVEKMETVETRTDNDASTSYKHTYRRTYFATVSFTINGTPVTKCIRLPLSPSANQVLEGKDVELVVHPSSPTKPLIKSVYQDRPKLGRR